MLYSRTALPTLTRRCFNPAPSSLRPHFIGDDRTDRTEANVERARTSHLTLTHRSCETGARISLFGHRDTKIRSCPCDLSRISFDPAQVEGTPTLIASGRASKIPPIYKRPTTSNISVEEGGVSNVLKSCNGQPLPLSVTRGVRSRPLDEGTATSTKVETVPLLSPTMESELLKEPWVFPRTKASPIKEEDYTFCAWGEDFQDLSSWCMDTFQGHFHIGESTTFKRSGTKYEGNGVSTVEETKALKDLKNTIDDERWGMNNSVKREEPDKNRHLLPSGPASDRGKEYRNYEENNATGSWLTSPESAASTSTTSSKQHNANVSASIQSEYRARENQGDLVYACPTPSLDAIGNQHEMWDELRTIETTGSDTFDLLSYLWEDEICSPEGSVSTDSSAMLKVARQQVATTAPSLPSSAYPSASAKVKTEMGDLAPPRRMETRASSTVTSSTVETPVTPSRRSERTRVAPSSGAVKEKEKMMITRTKKDKTERKRYYESDSEEDVTLVQYRECREKNNEASRRSRMNKKAKESEMTMRASKLERDNRILKMKVEELEKLVTSMRSALLRSALKKEQ